MRAMPLLAAQAGTMNSNDTRTRTFAPIAAVAVAAALTLVPAMPASAAPTGFISVSNNCGTTISVSVRRNGAVITSDTIENGAIESFYLAAGGGYTVVNSLGGSHSVYVMADRTYGFSAC